MDSLAILLYMYEWLLVKHIKDCNHIFLNCFQYYKLLTQTKMAYRDDLQRFTTNKCIQNLKFNLKQKHENNTIQFISQMSISADFFFICMTFMTRYISNVSFISCVERNVFANDAFSMRHFRRWCLYFKYLKI